jgi:hypothetical protein
MINDLPDKLKNDIIQYCKLNNIEDINSFIIKLIRQSLTIEIYGREPDIFSTKKIDSEIKEEVLIVKTEEIKVENEIKNEYQINVDLNKKTEVIEQSTETPNKKIEVLDEPTQPSNKNDDIYGEGLFGKFGGSNLYDLLKRKK